MADYRKLERALTSALALSRRPVAVAALDSPPAGVAQFTGTVPSGCSFWRLAQDGRTFYTLPGDHYNCPVGSYTHNIPLPADREQELPQVLGLMANIGYIRMEEVPAVPRLAKTPGAIVYAPLGDAPVTPDAVIVAGKPGSLMLLHEAAGRGERTMLPLMGRPTCMAIPAVMSGGVASSLGCVGNRIYTLLGDEEFYAVIAERDAQIIADQLSTIRVANAALTEYHQERRASLLRT